MDSNHAWLSGSAFTTNLGVWLYACMLVCMCVTVLLLRWIWGSTQRHAHPESTLAPCNQINEQFLWDDIHCNYTRWTYSPNILFKRINNKISTRNTSIRRTFNNQQTSTKNIFQHHQSTTFSIFQHHQSTNKIQPFSTLTINIIPQHQWRIGAAHANPSTTKAQEAAVQDQHFIFQDLDCRSEVHGPAGLREPSRTSRHWPTMVGFMVG